MDQGELLLIAISAIVAVLTGVGVYFAWLKFRQEDSPRHDTPGQTQSQSVIVFPPPAPAVGAARSEDETADEVNQRGGGSGTQRRRTASISSKPKSRKQPPPSTWEELLTETINVPSGTYGWVSFDLERGAEVRGTAGETDDYPFTILVLDESNYSSYRRGEDYACTFEDEDVPVSHVNFVAPESDRFYVVVVTKGKQLQRDVELDLRVKRPAS
jgi:hypothetical protein